MLGYHFSLDTGPPFLTCCHAWKWRIKPTRLEMTSKIASHGRIDVSVLRHHENKIKEWCESEQEKSQKSMKPVNLNKGYWMNGRWNLHLNENDIGFMNISFSKDYAVWNEFFSDSQNTNFRCLINELISGHTQNTNLNIQ